MSALTIQEINRNIMYGNWTNDELNLIMSAVQCARSQLRQEKIRSFSKGDTVRFHSQKRGVTVTGTVTKIAIKYVTVKEGAVLWRVPANMLEAA